MNDSPPPRWLLRGLQIAIVCGAILQWGVLWFSGIPLGVPGEWTWDRLSSAGSLLLDAAPAIGIGVLLAGYVVFGARSIQQNARRPRTGFVPGLWGLGFLWLLSVVASTPGIASLTRVPFVLYYTRSSGYFTQAEEHRHDVQKFLSGYRERIADSSNPENHLHLGTHPPGLTLGFITMLRLSESLPVLPDILDFITPQQVSDGADAVYQTELLGGKGHKFQKVERAVLWWGALLTAFMASGTLVPLYSLVRRNFDSITAWWVAALWLLVPAAAIFFPKSDIMFPCLTIWAQLLWLKALDRESLWYGFATGAIMCLALTLSLAFVPVALILFLQGIAVSHRSSSADVSSRWNRARLKVYGGGVASLLIWLGAWAALGGMNLFAVWVQNLRNHAAFYAHHTRSYWPWLLENPVELGFAVGLPIAVLAVTGITLAVNSKATYLHEMIIPILVWLLLWISGKNMGEAARLWVFLMPYVLWSAAPTVQRLGVTLQGRRTLTACFLLQMFVCVTTAMRLDGFGFKELQP